MFICLPTISSTMRDETMIATMTPIMHSLDAHSPRKHHQHVPQHSFTSFKIKSKVPKARMTSRTFTRQITTIGDLPNEILSKVFAESTDIRSILNLAATCKHLKGVWATCKKVQILQRAASHEYAPYEEAVQLVTYNRSEPAHTRRNPPVSLALVKQVVKVGNTANRWLDKYPQLRWDDSNAADRRLLTRDESERFRKALYRFWLYSTAFHSADFLQLPGYSTHIRASTMDRRLMLIRHFTTKDIIECGEVHELIHNFVRAEICPSNSSIQTQYNFLNPDRDPIYFGSYSAYLDCSLSNISVQPRRDRDLATNLARESWGSETAARGKAADVMKLNPAELLWVQENLQRKAERVDYFETLEHFHSRPATFRAALESVMFEREDCTLGGIYDYEGWAGILYHEDEDLHEHYTHEVECSGSEG